MENKKRAKAAMGGKNEKRGTPTHHDSQGQAFYESKLPEYSTGGESESGIG
jgi:hypothetical protein